MKPETSALNPSKPTILVVEDNADQWFLIRWTLLQQFPELEAVWIDEESRVMPYLNASVVNRNELPVLILLDLYLPSAAMGYSVLKAIKNHPVYQHLPTIVLSQSADPDDINESFNCATNSYIVKPIRYQDWLEAFSLLRMYWKGSGTLH